jgi:hypothetical protein
MSKNQIWEDIRCLKVSVFALPERTLDPHFLEKKVELDSKLIVKLKLAVSRPAIVDLLEKKGYKVEETTGTEDLILEKK